MAQEIEIKLKVDNHAPVRARLQQLGATRVSERLETNIFFDTPNRALLAGDRGLRLRCQRDLSTREEKLILTYKGPRSEGLVKNREEIELHVDDSAAATALLAHLGYQQFLSFEKRRETWKLGSSLIELDTLPQLGTFVEIESPTEAEVLSLRETLNLANTSAVPSTYPELVVKHLAATGTQVNKLAFP